MSARTIYAYGRVWTGYEWDAEQDRLAAPTGRIVWEGTPTTCPFEPRWGPMESNREAEAPLGAQFGTSFKTSLEHEGQPVWWWGGVHPVDLSEGVAAGWGRRHDVPWLLGATDRSLWCSCGRPLPCASAHPPLAAAAMRGES